LESSIKKEIIRLLKEDEEFRYMVAGLIGLRELLEGTRRIENEQTALREEQTKIWEEIRAMRAEQVALREEQTKIWEEIRAMRAEQVALREDFNTLREDFNKMLGVLQQMNVRLTRIERTVEKMTVDIEEEARAFVKYRLGEKGIKIDVDELRLPEAEINIYGANEEICVIGEATIRAGVKILDEILEKYELLKRKYPSYLRDKVIFVLYVLLPLPEVIEEAKKRNIWVFKATKEYVSLDYVLEHIK